MNDIVKIKEANKSNLSLEGILENLSNYGRPSLSLHDRGWHARLNVFVTGKGVEFDVKSEFTHATPKDAVNTLTDRLDKALSDLGVR